MQLYVACSGGVVCLGIETVRDSGLMIRPQVPEYSRPFQLSLLRIVGGKRMCGVIIEDEISFSWASGLREIKGQTRQVY